MDSELLLAFLGFLYRFTGEPVLSVRCEGFWSNPCASSKCGDLPVNPGDFVGSVGFFLPCEEVFSSGGVVVCMDNVESAMDE